MPKLYYPLVYNTLLCGGRLRLNPYGDRLGSAVVGGPAGSNDLFLFVGFEAVSAILGGESGRRAKIIKPGRSAICVCTYHQVLPGHDNSPPLRPGGERD